MAVVRLLLAYDGTGFRGWAAQPGVRTVEGLLGDVLERVLGGERPRLSVAGGTVAPGEHGADAPAPLGRARRRGDPDPRPGERVPSPDGPKPGRDARGGRGGKDGSRGHARGAGGPPPAGGGPRRSPPWARARP